MAEPKYPIRNTLRGTVKRVPLTVYSDYVSAQDSGSGEYMWEPMSPVPGVRTNNNGNFEQILIPTKHVRDAAVGGGSYSILRGSNDMRNELARQSSVEEARIEVAKDRGFAAVALDSGLSVATLGGTSGLANWLAGEGAAEARHESMRYNPMGHLAGRVLGVGAIGAAPVFGAVGRAAGVANAGSVFEIAAAASQTARGLVKGSGFMADFSRRVVGTVVYGGVAEAPLSIALGMADIVDNDKPFTAESIAAEVGHQYKWGMLLAGVTGLTTAGAVAGATALGRGAVKGAGAIGRSDIMQSVLHGGVRYASRKYLRGKAGGLGDALETGMHRVGSKAINEATKKASGMKIGRLLSGDATDNFIKRNRTRRQAIEALGEAKTAESFADAAQTLGYNVPPGQLADDLAFMASKTNAKNIVEAQHFAKALPEQLVAISAAAKTVKLRLPEGAKFVSQSRDILEDSLRTAASFERGPLQRQLTNIKLPRNKAKAYTETMELRRQMSDVGKAHVSKALRGVLDSPSAKKVDDILAQLDKFDRSRLVTEDLSTLLSSKRGLYSLEELQDLRAAAQGMGGSYRGLVGANMIRNPNVMKKFFDGDELQSSLKIDNRFDDFGSSIEALGRANRAQKELLFDASPLVSAKRPVTQHDILEAQLETVISTKNRIGVALKYIAMRGGGLRHTFAFTGVMMFRNLQTMDEKKAEFALRRAALVEQTASSGALEASVGAIVDPIASYDMSLGVHLAETLAAGDRYLLQQLPRSSDPMVGPTDFSGAEIENFLEAVGAVVDPISVLATAVDGSVTNQAVEAIKAVYPSLYAEMVIDIAEYLQEHRSEFGHAQMIGLDTFTGGALGYSDGPAPDLTMQPPYAQTQGQAQAIGGPENRRMNIQQNSTQAQKLAAF